MGAPCGSALHQRRVVEVGPFGHRAVVHADLAVAEHAEEERRQRGANATLSVGDGDRLRVDARSVEEAARLLQAVAPEVFVLREVIDEAIVATIFSATPP